MNYISLCTLGWKDERQEGRVTDVFLGQFVCEISMSAYVRKGRGEGGSISSETGFSRRLLQTTCRERTLHCHGTGEMTSQNILPSSARAMRA